LTEAYLGKKKGSGKKLRRPQTGHGASRQKVSIPVKEGRT